MKERLFGGRLFRAKSLVELSTVEHDFFKEKHGDRQHTKYDKRVCQCCGFRESRDSTATCICDGVEWYMQPDGSVVCAPHRMMRAIEAERRKSFSFGRFHL